MNNIKKVMGRPKVADKREIRIVVKVNKKEYAILEKHCKNFKIRVAKFVRMAAVKSSSREIKKTKIGNK